MKICVAGKGSIAVKCTDFLLKNINLKDICCIPASNDNGKDTWNLSFLKYCKLKNLEIKNLEQVKKIKDLIFLSIQYDQIIDIESFNTIYLYNLHFSLLPKYRGVYTPVYQILNNERISGCTIHKIDNGVDTGNIIAQKKFNIKKNSTAKELYFDLVKCGYKLFKNKIKSIIKNKPNGKKQKIYPNKLYLRKDFNFPGPRIDFNLKAGELERIINAYTFWPYQGFILKGKKIIKAMKTNSKSKNINEKINNKKKFFLKNSKDFKIKLFF
jgi:methionyl-tRNA formyltransferase